MTTTTKLTPFERKVKSRLKHTKESAASRGKDFNLDRDYIRNLLMQPVCAYSGETFGTDLDNKLSLERWDNDKGYIKGNVIAVKSKYNNARGNLSLQQLLAAAKMNDERAKTIDQPGTVKITGKAKQFYEVRQRVLANVESRKKALANWAKATEYSDVDLLRIETIKSRIASGETEAAHLLELIEKEMKKAKENPKRNVKTANNAAQTYGIIAKALLRFEYMNAHNYVRLKRGLPMIKGE